MNDAWKASKSAPTGTQRIAAAGSGAKPSRAGWKIVLSQTSADGGQVPITAECGK